MSAICLGITLETTLTTPTAPTAMKGNVTPSSPERMVNSGGRIFFNAETRSAEPPASLIETIFLQSRARRAQVSTPISPAVRLGTLYNINFSEVDSEIFL